MPATSMPQARPGRIRRLLRWGAGRARKALLGPSYLELPQQMARVTADLNKLTKRVSSFLEDEDVVRVFEEVPGALEAAEEHIEAVQEHIGTVEQRVGTFKEKSQEFRRQQVTKNRELSEGVAGLRVHLENARKKNEAMQREIELLKQVLESAAGNPEVLWLYANRVERLDATVPIYDEKRRQFHLARYEFAKDYVGGLHVADIACGLGYGTRMLAEAGAARAVGMDVCAHAIRYAAKLHAHPKAAFLCASAYEPPCASASFDVIVSFETIEHLPDDAPLVRAFARLLRPEGRLIVSTPNQWPLTVAPYHTREYDRAAFERVLEPCFRIDALYNQNSGSAWRYNHEQPPGIVATTPENQANAECYIAVCTRKDRTE